MCALLHNATSIKHRTTAKLESDTFTKTFQAFLLLDLLFN